VIDACHSGHLAQRFDEAIQEKQVGAGTLGLLTSARSDKVALSAAAEYFTQRFRFFLKTGVATLTELSSKLPCMANGYQVQLSETLDWEEVMRAKDELWRFVGVAVLGPPMEKPERSGASAC
jgi:hypothetical protein